MDKFTGRTLAPHFDFVRGVWVDARLPLVAGEAVRVATTGKVATLVEVTVRANWFDRWTLRGEDGAEFSLTDLFFARV